MTSQRVHTGAKHTAAPIKETLMSTKVMIVEDEGVVALDMTHELQSDGN